MFIVLVFLISIVLANLCALWFGPWATPINAFLLIGLNIGLRDKLHEAWRGKRLLSKMGGLIFAGGVITFLLNKDALMISIGSCAAFVTSMSVDAVIYELLIKRKRLLKINISNIGASITDSVLFPTIAFGQVLPLVIVAQIVAKIGGGFLWSLLLVRCRYRGDNEKHKICHCSVFCVFNSMYAKSARNCFGKRKCSVQPNKQTGLWENQQHAISRICVCRHANRH